MRFGKGLLLALALIFTSCLSDKITPTPLLISKLVSANNEVKALYLQCSTGANFAPELPTCNPTLLEEKSVATMSLAKEFISADIKQPQGYDIYLSVAMIYFRISVRNGNEYSEAERIARQFFEIQKASSGRALTEARFYWVAISTAKASWDWHNDRLALNAERKVDLLLCYAEGNAAFQDMDPGARRIRLLEYLEVLKALIEAIE